MQSIFNAFGLRAYTGGETVSPEIDEELEANAPRLQLSAEEEAEAEEYA